MKVRVQASRQSVSDDWMQAKATMTLIEWHPWVKFPPFFRRDARLCEYQLLVGQHARDLVMDMRSLGLNNNRINRLLHNLQRLLDFTPHDSLLEFSVECTVNLLEGRTQILIPN
jgi:hypothetical protein